MTTPPLKVSKETKNRKLRIIHNANSDLALNPESIPDVISDLMQEMHSIIAICIYMEKDKNDNKNYFYDKSRLTYEHPDDTYVEHHNDFDAEEMIKNCKKVIEKLRWPKLTKQEKEHIKKLASI